MSIQKNAKTNISGGKTHTHIFVKRSAGAHRTSVQKFRVYLSQTEWTLDSEGIWVFTHEPARTRGRPDSHFSTPHIKHGKNGKLTGALWSQVKPSDLKMEKIEKKKHFLLNRPAITAPRLVFHSDHVRLKPSDSKMEKNEKKTCFLLSKSQRSG